MKLLATLSCTFFILTAQIGHPIVLSPAFYPEALVLDLMMNVNAVLDEEDLCSPPASKVLSFTTRNFENEDTISMLDEREKSLLEEAKAKLAEPIVTGRI